LLKIVELVTEADDKQLGLYTARHSNRHLVSMNWRAKCRKGLVSAIGIIYLLVLI